MVTAKEELVVIREAAFGCLFRVSNFVLEVAKVISGPFLFFNIIEALPLGVVLGLTLFGAIAAMLYVSTGQLDSDLLKKRGGKKTRHGS